MKQTFTLLFFVFFIHAASTQAQCVDKFPYSQDFEGFTNHQTDASCTATTVGDSSGGWYQDDQDDGDWRADSSGTASTGTGPGSTDTTSGVGDGKDYNPGTTAGTYLYTEGTGATCTNTTINLLSPCFDFSGTTYYQLSFAYHMHGTAMGSLSVDVFDGTKWISDVWTIKGDQGENWHVAKVGLANYNGTAVQLRIRAVMGVNFLSDCAIDDMNIAAYTPDEYDGQIFSSKIYTEDGYFFMPDGHIDSIFADVTIRNNGVKSITGVSIITTVPSGADTLYIGTIAPGARDTLIQYVSHLPSKSDTIVRIELTLNETDANTSDNVVTAAIGPNESIYSRDDGTVEGGVGAGAPIEIGNFYKLLKDDTLTTASFFINGGPAGDSVRLNLYNATGGTPTSLVDRSEFVVLSGQPEWYTVALGSPGCDQELKKGDYFLAVQQVNTINMGLGYGTNFYKRNKSMYNTGGGWTDLVLGGIGLNALVRMNLEEVVNPEIRLSIKDTLCKDVEYIATASGASTYAWEPFGIVQSKIGKTVKIQADTTFNIKVTGTDQCGKTGVLSKTITVIKTPDLNLSNDTTVCEFGSVLLKATTNNNYRWIGGPSNTSYGVNPGATSTYTAIADSFYGCKTTKNVTVTVSKPIPSVTSDTTICQAQPLQLVATGGSRYQWVNGPNTAIYSVKPNTNTRYIVRVIDTYNCSALDTVDVTTITGPPLFTSADTSICFGNRVLIKAFGADSYEWIGGPMTAEYTVLPLSTKNYYVRGYAGNGCYLTDSVNVLVAKIPKVKVRADTTICEGNTLDIVANTSDDVDFAWRSGPTSQKITVTPKITTEYKVVVTNTTGCYAEDSVLITVDPLPFLDFSMSQSHKTITILNNSLHGDSHSWNFGDGDSSKEKSVTHKYRVHGDYTLKYTITNKCGSKDTSYTVVVENLAVNDLLNGSVKVYPNPTREEVTIGFTDYVSGPVRIALHSVEGEVVKNWDFSTIETSNNLLLDLKSLASGAYLLQIHTSDGLITKRIIKL